MMAIFVMVADICDGDHIVMVANIVMMADICDGGRYL